MSFDRASRIADAVLDLTSDHGADVVCNGR